MPNERILTGAVAFLDILGFRHKASGIALERCRSALVEPIVRGALSSEGVLNRDFHYFEDPPRPSWLYFADSLVFFLPQTNDGVFDGEQVVVSVAHAVSIMAATAVWLNTPLRGAIALGEYLICSDPTFVAGEPVFEAHELETRQNWSGIALCDSASSVVTAESGPGLTTWAVPMKDGASESRWVVDWPLCVFTPRRPSGAPNELILPDWEACFDSPTESVQAKKRATMEFFEQRRATGRIGRILVPPDVRTRVTRSI